MKTHASFVVLACSLAGCAPATPLDALSPALSSAAVGVTDALEKVRPDFAVPSSTTALLDAARNEFEPFQIVVNGGANGVHGLTAKATELTGPATIPVAQVHLYQVGLYHVQYASNVEGAPGDWPDPLIPDVDSYFGEQRNGLPFDVAAGQSRAIWVEIEVPTGIPAGLYAGKVTVSASDLAETDVSVSLRVRNFDLPSTASLKSAFGFTVDNACRAHEGETYCQSDADARPFVLAYGRAALAHRLSFYSPYYTFPSNGDFSTFDGVTGTLLDGSATSGLGGAHMTTTRLGTHDASGMPATKAHFDQKGWNGLFDYTCDEPPATCAFSDIPTRAQPVHAAGIRTLVTTSIAQLEANQLLDAVDIVTPVIDQLWPNGSTDKRADYDAFLARSPQKELWHYQSCDEHGCASGCDPSQGSDPTHGWPSYMIDASGVQNRAMEWLSYRLRVSGELYFETAMHLDDAWNSFESGHNGLCDFGGNGDGALFYPGTPARIGGTHDIAVESQRLKLIREGMEDYEYLHLLEQLGDAADAQAIAAKLFPAAWQVTPTTPAQLYAARAQLADLIEKRMNPPPPTVVPRAPAPVDVHGDASVFQPAAPIVVSAGAAQASFRLLWDDAALYLDAEVNDAMLSAIGTGHDGDLWNADAVELMLDPLHERTAAPDASMRHVIVTVAGDLLEARGAGANEDRSISMNTSYAVTTDGSVNSGTASKGYRIVMAIPWSGVGVTPSAGLVLGGDLALDDLDGTQLSAADWAQVKPFAQPNAWNALTLAAPANGSADMPASPSSSTSSAPSSAGSLAVGCAMSGRAPVGGAVFFVVALVGVCVRTRRSRRA